MNTTKWNFVRSWTSVFSYRNFGLSKSRRNIEVLGYQYMPEVVLILHAPYRQPVNVVHRQVPRQNDFDVFTLISLQWCQTVETKIFARFSLIVILRTLSKGHAPFPLVWHFDTKRGRLWPVPNPEIRVRAGTIVMKIRYVKSFAIQNGDVPATETVGQPREFWQHSCLRHF